MSYFVGIDLGGTNIKAGIVNEKGEIIHKNRIKTRADRDQLEIIHDMGMLARQVIEEAGLTQADVLAIGIGSPGTPNNEAGTLIYANNLPFHQAPMRSEIRKVIDLPVFIDNDANVAALAESVAGASKGTNHSVAITLGTGVGGGVVINRRIYSGFNHAGCEVGHILVKAGGEPCTCGRKGCFESYASATAIIRETERAAAAHPESILNALITENGGKADGRTAFEGMRRGDKAAAAVVQEYMEMLSEGLANVINGYMPEVIVIGGGVCNEGDALLEPVRKLTLAKAYLGEGVPQPKIRLAEMGNDAGIVGAAMMASTCLEDHLRG
ncbi:MAG: ROK family protein [Clostridiaceae bacterium]|nr:ROK family protein [Clostridiaceae bacterium]